MVKVQVSQDFERAHARKAATLDDAKKAERRQLGLPVPVGTAGQMALSDIDTGMSKERKDEKTGQTYGGNPYINFKCIIQTPEEHKGKHMTKNWSLKEDQYKSYEQRYQTLLDDLEAMGLPREIRVEHDTLQELFQWFANQPEPFLINYEVIDVNGNTYLSIQSADQAAAAQQASQAANRTVEVGQEVKFLGGDYVVKEILADGLVQIENPQGKQREAQIADLVF